MNKAILISVRPLLCELIASGKKTIEVRKTKPKLETPFPAYLYCTMAKTSDEYLWTAASAIIGKYADVSNGKVIGEFVCDRITEYPYEPCNVREHYMPFHYMPFGELEKTCLNGIQLYDYLKTQDGYGWHISDLLIYDKLRAIEDFGITRPPRSWCYVEGL